MQSARPNQPEELKTLVETYYQVYVLENLEGLLAAAPSVKDKLIVLQLLRDAFSDDEVTYRIKISKAYKYDEDVLAVLLVYRRLIHGDLHPDDSLIIHLRHICPEIDLSERCQLISTEMKRYCSRFIQESSKRLIILCPQLQFVNNEISLRQSRLHARYSPRSAKENSTGDNEGDSPRIWKTRV